jgi:hypothetical protein
VNKEMPTDEQYLREVSEKWNSCPICGYKSGFESVVILTTLLESGIKYRKLYI